MARNSQKTYVEIKPNETSYFLDKIGSQPRRILSLEMLGENLTGLPELKSVIRYFEIKKYFPQIFANLTSYVICRLYFSEEARKKSERSQIRGVLFLQVTTDLINIISKS